MQKLLKLVRAISNAITSGMTYMHRNIGAYVVDEPGSDAEYHSSDAGGNRDGKRDNRTDTGNDRTNTSNNNSDAGNERTDVGNDRADTSDNHDDAGDDLGDASDDIEDDRDDKDYESTAEEPWQVGGRRLYKITQDFLEERQTFFSQNNFGYNRKNSGNVVKEHSLVTDEANNSKVFQCFMGNKTRFWASGDKAFCVYYHECAQGYDMYVHFFRGNESRVISSKVNSAPFSVEHVESYEPVFAVFEGNDEYRITFVHVEDQDISPWEESSKKSNAMVISQYVTWVAANDSLIVRGRSYRLEGASDDLYRNPLAVLHDVKGDVLVAGKYKGDSRLSATDQGYFLWRFSAETLAPVIRRNRMSQDIRSYLFRRFGGSSLERPDHLVMWNRGNDRLALTYIGNFLSVKDQEYYHPYKAFDAVFFRNKATARLMVLRQCLIGTSLCNIEARGVVLTAERIKLLKGIIVGRERYLFYVTRSLGTLLTEGLSVAVLGEVTYTVFEDIVPIRFSASALNLKRDVDGAHVEVMLLDTASSHVHVYRIDLRQLKSKVGCNIEAFSINCRNLDVQGMIALSGREVHEVLSAIKESGVVIKGITAVEWNNSDFSAPRMYAFKASIVNHSHAGVRDFAVRDPTVWVTMGSQTGIEEKTTQVRDLLSQGTEGDRNTVLSAIERSSTVAVLPSRASLSTFTNGSMEVAALRMQGNAHRSSTTDGVEVTDAHSLVHTTAQYGAENSSANGLLNSNASAVGNGLSINRYSEQNSYFGVGEGIIVLGALGIIIALIVAIYAIVTYVRNRSTGYRVEVAGNVPEGDIASSAYVALGEYNFGEYDEERASERNATLDVALPIETHACSSVDCVLCKEVESTSMFSQATSKL